MHGACGFSDVINKLKSNILDPASKISRCCITSHPYIKRQEKSGFTRHVSIILSNRLMECGGGGG
jgi:hypothetical protein